MPNGLPTTTTARHNNKYAFQTATEGTPKNAKVCCKENKVPVYCLGFCKGGKKKASSGRSFGSIGKCKHHLPTIEKCIEFANDLVSIFRLHLSLIVQTSHSISDIGL